MSNTSYFIAPPICSRCKFRTTFAITNKNNPLGNADRPYYACRTPDCRKFYCFDDYRGISEENPSCDCGKPSRLTVRKSASSQSRDLVFQCATGACGYKVQESDENGNGRTLKEADIPQWVQDGKI